MIEHPDRPAGSSDLVAELRGLVLARIGSVVSPGAPVALLDFPNHANVGDTAIYLGERAALAALGHEVGYVATAASYHAAHLRRALGRDGTILLHGGGNLGDLWPVFQRFRERVIREHPERRIVVLPQTIRYADDASARASAEVFARHPDLHLLVRDATSLAFARARFPSVETQLCPDAAFALGPLRPGPARRDVLLVARTDQESGHTWPAPAPAGVAVADWPEPSPRLRLERELTRVLAFPLKRASGRAGWLNVPLRRLYTDLSHRRLTGGLDVLGGGRVIVTDRLHGHVLCLLLGRPHVLLDNSYGKNRTFYDAWTSGSPLVRWADSPAEALQRASEVLG